MNGRATNNSALLDCAAHVAHKTVLLVDNNPTPSVSRPTVATPTTLATTTTTTTAAATAKHRVELSQCRVVEHVLSLSRCGTHAADKINIITICTITTTIVATTTTTTHDGVDVRHNGSHHHRQERRNINTTLQPQTSIQLQLQLPLQRRNK